MNNNAAFHELSIRSGIDRCSGGQSKVKQAVFALPPCQHYAPKHFAGQFSLLDTIEPVATATLVLIV